MPAEAVDDRSNRKATIAWMRLFTFATAGQDREHPRAWHYDAPSTCSAAARHTIDRKPAVDVELVVALASLLHPRWVSRWDHRVASASTTRTRRTIGEPDPFAAARRIVAGTFGRAPHRPA